VTTFWVELLGVDIQQRFLDAGGVRTRALVSGSPDQPPLLLLHGTGGHAEAYLRNLGPLGEHFRTIAIDMLGHGFTDKPESSYEIDAYIEHALAVLDAEGIESAHVSGESLGGWVAARLAARHPDRVRRLNLNTAGGYTADPAVMARIRELTLAAVREASRDTVRARLEWLMADPASVTDELVEIRLAVYRQPEFQHVIERILCLQDPATRERNLLTDAELASITHPTLVVWTTHDPTAPVEVGKAIAAQISDAQFAVLENCGHWPQFEASAAFNRLLLEFLTS
jgi:2-hydroxy-6-oxonona-2,4-dienedioate hydrolase